MIYGWTTTTRKKFLFGIFNHLRPSETLSALSLRKHLYLPSQNGEQNFNQSLDVRRHTDCIQRALDNHKR